MLWYQPFQPYHPLPELQGFQGFILRVQIQVWYVSKTSILLERLKFHSMFRVHFTLRNIKPVVALVVMVDPFAMFTSL